MMYRNSIGIVGALLLCGFGVHAWAQEIAAESFQQPSAIQISPARFDWKVKNGETRSEKINIKNYSDKPWKVDVHVEDFYVSSDSLQAEFFVPEDQHPLKAYDMINWVSTSEENMVLAPHESRNIDFTIAVPADTPSGGYYGAIFFQSSEESLDEKDDAQIRINTRVGVLVTLAVHGDAELQTGAELKSFTVDKEFSWGEPLTFMARVGNTGNIHFRMNGKITIDRMGKRFAEVEMPSHLYYPERDRVLQLPPWNPGKWTIGRFTAHTHLVAEDGSVTLDGDTAFIVVSWRVIASVVGVLFTVWVIYMLGVGAAKRKIQRAQSS